MVSFDFTFHFYKKRSTLVSSVLRRQTTALVLRGVISVNLNSPLSCQQVGKKKRFVEVCDVKKKMEGICVVSLSSGCGTTED